MIELGRLGRDKLTGFEGIIVGRCQYLTGCDQYGLIPKAKDGEVKGSQWFDEGRIEVIGDGVTIEEVTSDKTGGPNRDAPTGY